jgi:hypothetical protein
VELLGLRADSAQLVGGPALPLQRTERGTRLALPELGDEPAHALALGGAKAL